MLSLTDIINMNIFTESLVIYLPEIYEVLLTWMSLVTFKQKLVNYYLFLNKKGSC